MIPSEISLCKEMKKVVVYFETYNLDSDWRWLPRLISDEIEWSTYCNSDLPLIGKVRKPLLGRYAAIARIVIKAKFQQVDVIVCHHTITATWLGILKKYFRFKADILAFSYTHPRWEQYSEERKDFFKKGARQIDRFLMFSSLEARQYPAALGVAETKFDMIHWSMNKPDVEIDSKPVVEGAYICAIGGEGRDYHTLVEAVRTLPHIRLAIVARPDNLKGIDLPQNVELFTSIPYGQAMNILVHSNFTILPLLSSTVPCGHGTLIAGFLLEVPTIVTASEAMSDYTKNGENVLTFKEQDPSSLREAISSLWGNDALCEKLMVEAKTFAETYCSEKATEDYFIKYLESKEI